jgi:hypothetical protein
LHGPPVLCIALPSVLPLGQWLGSKSPSSQHLGSAYVKALFVYFV